MFNMDDYEYESGDSDDLIEYNSETVAELKLDQDLLIVQFYKNLLIMEPEFIGINNICCADLLYLINSTIVPIKLMKKDHILNQEQNKIFTNMYRDLKIKCGSSAIYNSVTKKIFNKIYV